MSRKVQKVIGGVDRMLAAGVPLAQIARQTGASLKTVQRRRQALDSQAKPSSAVGVNDTQSVAKPNEPPRPSWGELLDAAFARGKQSRAAYRDLIRRWIRSGADLGAPAVYGAAHDCACTDEDITRSRCPHDGGERSGPEFDREMDAWHRRVTASAES